MHHRVNTAALLAGIVISIPASAVFMASSAIAAPKIQEISQPGVRSQWAYLEKRTFAYSRPSLSAPKVARLGLGTPEHTSNLVYVEARTTTGSPWYRVRLPAARRTGWVPRSRLGGLQSLSTYIIINRATRTLTLIKAGQTKFTTRVGIGKSGTPTPAGEFYVREKLHGFKSPVYGPRALGLSATSHTLTDWPGGGFIGVHGTNEPNLIPGRISHGCVRLRNASILKLYGLVSVGTPVTIE